MAKARLKVDKVHTLRISLDGSDPAIWRRFRIGGDSTLGDLHGVIQMVMGWTESHLHAFRIGDNEYSAPNPYGEDFEEEFIDEGSVRVGEVLTRKGQGFGYLYDFGDSWEHTLKVESISDPEPGVHYPVCCEGELSCPPDDCGGVYGYYRILEIVSDPSHEEYGEYKEWLGDGFDPDRFDLEEVNEFLRDPEKYFGRWEFE